jgi:hypothetical protein
VWGYSYLYNFTGGNDGGLPQYGSLIFDAEGNLYGITQNAVINGYGVAFELSPSLEGEWTETLLHAFAEMQRTADIRWRSRAIRKEICTALRRRVGVSDGDWYLNFRRLREARGRKRFFTTLPTTIPMAGYGWQELLFAETNSTVRPSMAALTLGGCVSTYPNEEGLGGNGSP